MHFLQHNHVIEGQQVMFDKGNLWSAGFRAPAEQSSCIPRDKSALAWKDPQCQPARSTTGRCPPCACAELQSTAP
eukprot:3167527-Karenia_brevis.AAC.1